jgi:hypothetical protein
MSVKKDLIQSTFLTVLDYGGIVFVQASASRPTLTLNTVHYGQGRINAGVSWG